MGGVSVYDISLNGLSGSDQRRKNTILYRYTTLEFLWGRG
jgi:hypothetical protein